MDKMRKKKTLVLSAAIASMLLPPLTMNAQYDEHKYGLQPWFKSSLMRREGSTVGGSTLGNEAFGAAGSQIDNEPFGAPLGGGLGILLAAGAGYALIQSKKNKQN
jgi:hypothetical protein